MARMDQTIAALSTPPGESGLAMIRISGQEAFAIVAEVFRAKDGNNRTIGWEHRRLYHGIIVNAKGEAIDEVMCAVMQAPESYTGDDTVELTCHGGMVIVNEILDTLFSLGAKAAEPGEFTKRAFLNGKLDLIQAEAVCDLIHAKSELQRKVAHEQLKGNLSKRIQRLADETLNLLGVIEANIDFIEEDIDIFDTRAAVELLSRQRRTLGELLESASISRPFREGYNVAISGPVNAGKSSLFNRVVGEQRAIVTDIPGTTRDVLREPIVIDGLVFVLQDTAGLRNPITDTVESIGLGRAEQAASSADLVIFVIDASVHLTKEVIERITKLDPDRTIIVLNKMDLPVVVTMDRMESEFPCRHLLSLSAKTGVGMESLKQSLVDAAGREQLSWIARERVVLNSRLVSLLETADQRADDLIGSIEAGSSLEILAVEARELLGSYEEATGNKYTENLLDNIFSRFCIGK